MSWIFIYLYVIGGLILVILVVSYWTELSVGLNDETGEDKTVKFGDVWLW